MMCTSVVFVGILRHAINEYVVKQSVLFLDILTISCQKVYILAIEMIQCWMHIQRQ